MSRTDREAALRVRDAYLGQMAVREATSVLAVRELLARDPDLVLAYNDAWHPAMLTKSLPYMWMAITKGSQGRVKDDGFTNNEDRKRYMRMWGDHARDLNYKSKATFTPSEFVGLFQAICPSYNNFKPGFVGQVLRRFPVKVRPAREGSVCLYIEGNEADLKALASLGGRFAPMNPDSPTSLYEYRGHPLKADEISFGKDGTLRLWWD